MFIRKDHNYHGVATPDLPWEYNLDDYGIVYGPGPWPWYGYVRQRLAQTPTTIPVEASIQIAPDTEFRAWGNQSVRLGPGFNDPFQLDYTIQLTIRSHGSWFRLLTVDGSIDLRKQTIEPPPPRLFARHPQWAIEWERKTIRILRFYARGIEERNRGMKTPVYAHSKWQAEEAAKAGNAHTPSVANVPA